MIITIIIIGALLLACVLVLRNPSQFSIASEWNTYEDSKLESTERMLGPLARVFSRSNSVRRLSQPTRINDVINRDLKISGAFNSSLDIFYSVQLAAIVTGISLIGVSYLQIFGGLLSVMLAVIGITLALWPILQVRKLAKAKRSIILDELPEFADLLLMAITTMTIESALTFTAERATGIVGAEIRELLRALNNRTIDAAKLFEITAQRLGTPEGKEFIGALQATWIDKAATATNIQAQVNSLRELQYQKQRGIAKRLPITLVITFTIHFMPLLFILGFLPVFTSLTGLK
jgi:Flp pilus assembly protein TadB